MTKIEIIERLQLIVDIANAPANGYYYELIVSDWAKYGKDRTYFKIRETRENSKHFAEKDYGYFDNISESFVPGKSSVDYRFSGAKLTEEDLSVKEEEPVEEVETVNEETTEEADEESSVSVMKIWCCRFPEINITEYTYCESDAFLKYRKLTDCGYAGTMISVLVPFSEKSGFPVAASKLFAPKREVADVPADFDWLEAICSNTLPEIPEASKESACVRFPEVSEDGTVSDPDGLIQSWKSSGWNGDVIDVVWSGDIYDAPERNNSDICVWHESTPYVYIPAEPGCPVNRSIAYTTKSNLF